MDIYNSTKNIGDADKIAATYAEAVRWGLLYGIWKDNDVCYDIDFVLTTIGTMTPDAVFEFLALMKAQARAAEEAEAEREVWKSTLFHSDERNG